MNNLFLVTGLWRSGSSMMMQILEAGEIKPIYHYLAPDKYNENGYYEIDENRAERVYAEVLGGLHPDSCVKVLIPFLQKNKLINLADRVIFISRNIDEVIASTNQKFGYKPYKRRLLTDEYNAKIFLADQHIPVTYLNYNEIIENPVKALAPIQHHVKNFKKAVNMVSKEMQHHVSILQNK